nr:disease resistance protein RPM1-like [Ipomoea trifida]
MAKAAVEFLLDQLSEESDLVGIENPKQSLVNLLLAVDDDLRVHSVVGMGGLGKTTLVKKVYDDAKVMEHFQCRVWLTVSETFRIEELLSDVIRQLVKQTSHALPQDFEAMNSIQLKDFIPLKVLNLTGAQLEEIPEEVFSLFQLKYLSLRGTNLRSVSKSIGRLQNLETLDLKWTSVTEFPTELLQLCKLRHLLLQKMPSLISNIQDAYMPFPVFEVYIWEGVLRGYLNDLPMLTYLEFYKCYETEGLCFKKFSKLKIMYIRGFEALKWIRIEEGALANLIELHFRECELLEQDPVKYRDNMSSAFRSFLKGLLDKEIHAPEATAARGNGNI